MDIKATGGTKLSGVITPSGNKNAALPMLCASLLTSQPVTIKNLPALLDVRMIVEVLEKLGSKITWDQVLSTITIQNDQISLANFNGDIPLTIRSSLLLIAPLVSRFHNLTIDTGIRGCSLGVREIDPHVEMLAKLGAKVSSENGKLTLSIDGRFTGSNLWPDYASVTATENVVMATVLAKGTTVMNNAASEPHVQDLCQMLNKMGAKITGVGSSQLTIQGVEELSGGEFEISSDHHEITTFLALAAMTGGKIQVKKALPEHFPLIVHNFAKLGVQINYDGETATVEEGQTFEPLVPFSKNYIPRIEAAPWPYFPADLLPLMVALSLKTKGPTRFWNKVYEGGLFWVTELTKMGAKIEVSDPHRILVLGPTKLHAASELECPYIIRATVAILMAAMVAEGTSTLKNVDVIDRGHPNFLKNLASLGANIEKI